MSSRLGITTVSLLLLALVGMADIVAQAQEAAANSYRFNQPIPVTIRKSNNSILQTLLVGINETGITVMSPQGRTVEHPNNSFRIVRSPDGSFSYSPGKDDVAELIQRLNQAQPANANPNGAGAAPAQPGAGGVPFTVSGTQPQPGAAHSQPAGPGIGGNNAAAEMARMAAHAQAVNANPPGSAFPLPTGPHSQTPFTTSPMPTMPMGTHAQMPGSTMPNTMPHSQASAPHNMNMPNMNPPNMNMPNMNMPNMNMPNMNTAPQQMVWEYQCGKCRHKFTSAVEIQAGHKCTKCGVVWGQVKDENGRVMSSSPAAKIGGGVGIVVVVIGIIAAIARKVNAA